MQRLFGTAAIGGSTWIIITAVAASVYVLVEFEKLAIRRRNSRPLHGSAA
jgi:hypothetical protein